MSEIGMFQERSLQSCLQLSAQRSAIQSAHNQFQTNSEKTKNRNQASRHLARGIRQAARTAPAPQYAAIMPAVHRTVAEKGEYLPANHPNPQCQSKPTPNATARTTGHSSVPDAAES